MSSAAPSIPPSRARPSPSLTSPPTATPTPACSPVPFSTLWMLSSPSPSCCSPPLLPPSLLRSDSSTSAVLASPSLYLPSSLDLSALQPSPAYPSSLYHPFAAEHTRHSFSTTSAHLQVPSSLYPHTLRLTPSPSLPSPVLLQPALHSPPIPLRLPSHPTPCAQALVWPHVPAHTTLLPWQSSLPPPYQAAPQPSCGPFYPNDPSRPPLQLHARRAPHLSCDDDELHLTYKTELCLQQLQCGACSADGECRHAHSFEELRPVQYDSKFKTELCKRYHTAGKEGGERGGRGGGVGCRFGVRCKFIHDEVRVKAGDGEYWLCSEAEGIIRVEVVPLHHFHRRALLDQLTFFPPTGPVSPLSASPVTPREGCARAARRSHSHSHSQHPTWVHRMDLLPHPALPLFPLPSIALNPFSPHAGHPSPATSSRSLPVHLGEDVHGPAQQSTTARQVNSQPLLCRRLGEGEDGVERGVRALADEDGFSLRGM